MPTGRESEVHNWQRPPLEGPRPPRTVLGLVPALPETLHSALEVDAADYPDDER